MDRFNGAVRTEEAQGAATRTGAPLCTTAARLVQARAQRVHNAAQTPAFVYSGHVGSEEHGLSSAPALRGGRHDDPGLGPPAPRELAVFVGDTIAVHPLHASLHESGQVSIGRGEGNDIRIDDASVSRRHAILHLGPPLRIEDLGSANGTFVRDRDASEEDGATHDLRPISRQAVEIALGERINLGRTMVVVRKASRPSGSGARPSPLRGEDTGPAPSPSAGRTGPPPSSASAAGPSAGRGGAETRVEAAVVRDPRMLAIYAEAYRAASAMISVLVLGETGVGKEVLARAIHRRSPRAAGPFIALNCAALPESLLETELFGHERGAFTGAVEARSGLFEAAAGGTVFLDEVGELSMSIQVKLLRVLEDRRVFRVGARAARAIDIRFMAATNRDLEDDVARGAFRKDLFFRLNGIALTIPPLRERTAEIAPLAERFVESACQELERRVRPILADEAIALLERYPWPGNARELRNIVDRAVVLCDGDLILPEHLPAKLFGNASPSPSPPSAEVRPSDAPTMLGASPPGAPADRMENLRSQMEEIERRRILDALERCGGNQTQAAELLGIARRTLINRLDEYNLPRPRKKP
jgi:two-component system response regulator AtoC